MEVSTIEPTEPGQTTGLNTTFTVYTTLSVDNVDELRVTKDGETLATRSAGTSRPPLGAEVSISADGIAATWTSSDVDGDVDLTHSVYVRSASDDTWRIAAASLTGDSVDVPRLGLLASTTTRVRIEVSDGIHARTLETQDLTIEPAAPALEILAPDDGLAMSSSRSLLLDGFAYDLDDPAGLDDSDVVWTSSRDGHLAIGQTATIPEGTLTPGTHTITVTVTATSGLATSKSVTVVVDQLTTSSSLVNQVIEISKLAFPGGADGVVIGRDDKFADSPASGLVQAEIDGPLLLTATASLPTATRNEITRLGATRAVIMGGTAAVSANVEAQLRGMGLTITRLAGETRYDTAKLTGEGFGGTSTRAILVRGIGTIESPSSAWADSIGGGALAASSRTRILLTRQDRIPPETAAALSEITHVTILGGTAAVSQAVEDEIRALGITVVRLFGEARQDTAVEIADALNPNAPTAFIVDGYDPDGWAAGFAAASLARDHTVVVLLGHPSRTLDASVTRAGDAAVVCGPNVSTTTCSAFR